MQNDLKLIKNKYGEAMMHLCRELFPTILENDGLLFQILSNHFDYSKDLCKDIVEYDKIVEFKDYIYSFFDAKTSEEIVPTSPEKLLDEAGYILYECKTESDIQSFKKYYAKGEELCTFKGNRLDNYYVFFAVKKDVQNIKREDFENPKREDLYGTSVISIQFSKGINNTLSIKNRYNHKVNNPDATFSNNLENIIPGLTRAFSFKYNLNINSFDGHLWIRNYVLANDNKFYKYNYEINNIYYCPNNIIIDNFKVKKYDKERYIIFDTFILDRKEKNIKLYDETIKDSFIDGFKSIQKTFVVNEKNTKKVFINDDIQIVLDKNNKILFYENNSLETVKDNFLKYSIYLKLINLLNLQIAGDNFLQYNETLQEINFPKLKLVRNNFFKYNKKISNINLPNLESVGDNFLQSNIKLTILDLPKVKKIGDSFLFNNPKINSINLPSLVEVGDLFFKANEELEVVDLPKLETVGLGFISLNDKIVLLNLPNVKKIDDYFLDKNNSLREVILPSVEEIGNCFIYSNEIINKLYLGNLKKVGHSFLQCNKNLKELYLPNLKEVEYLFLYDNHNITKISLPNLESKYFYCFNNKMKAKLNCEKIKNKVLNLVKTKKYNTYKSQ